MVVIGIMVSNSLFAQDTSHTRLVDKYYPVSKAPTQPAPELNKATTEPVNNTVNTPATSGTIQQSPSVNMANKLKAPVTPTTPSQVQNSLSPANRNPNTGEGTDNFNPDSGSPIYRDTRLGSSSPLYNTYKKNDNGAGAITTNPNKGG